MPMTQADQPDPNQPDPIIAGIRGFLAVDPLKALDELIRAEHRARLRSLGEAHRIGLRSLRAEFLKHRTDLLRQVNQHCREQASCTSSDTPTAHRPAVLAPLLSSSDPAEAQSLQYRLSNKKESLRLIQERITEYVLTTDVPLQDRKEEKLCISEIKQLEQQLGVEVGAYDEPELKEGLAQELLNLIALFHDEPLGTQLAILRPVIANLALPDPLDGLQVVTAAIRLWDSFNQSVRALVVTVFAWVQLQSDPLPKRQVEEAFQRKPKLRRIAADTAFLQWPGVKQYETPIYQWPAKHGGVQEDRSDVIDFLQDTGLATNPFWFDQAQSDALSLMNYTIPQQGEEIIRRRPMILVSREPQDRALLRWLMSNHKIKSTKDEQAVQPKYFRIECDLTDEYGQASQPVIMHLDLIAHGAAQTWLEFLPSNAGAWFDLLPRQQFLLVDLLAWHAQSIQRPIELLRHNDLAEDGEAQALQEDMVVRLNKVTVVRQPREAELLRWLEVRPPGLNYTSALLECPFTSSQEIETALNRSVAVSNRLLEADVILKIFASESPAAVLGEDLDTLPIVWSERNLAQMLDDRIRLTAERGYRTFADLFFPDERAGEVTSTLTRSANGSLGRLQRLGQKIVQAHVVADLTAWDVDLALKTIHEQP